MKRMLFLSLALLMTSQAVAMDRAVAAWNEHGPSSDGLKTAAYVAGGLVAGQLVVVPAARYAGRRTAAGASWMSDGACVLAKKTQRGTRHQMRDRLPRGLCDFLCVKEDDTPPASPTPGDVVLHPSGDFVTVGQLEAALAQKVGAEALEALKADVDSGFEGSRRRDDGLDERVRVLESADDE